MRSTQESDAATQALRPCSPRAPTRRPGFHRPTTAPRLRKGGGDADRRCNPALNARGGESTPPVAANITNAPETALWRPARTSTRAVDLAESPSTTDRARTLEGAVDVKGII